MIYIWNLFSNKNKSVNVHKCMSLIDKYVSHNDIAQLSLS